MTVRRSWMPDHLDRTIRSALGLLLIVLAAGASGSLAAAQAATPSYSERVGARPELISYWRLGETSGSVAVDDKSGRNGTYKGGVVLGQPGALSADPNKAAGFDGVNDSVVLSTLPSATSFTVEGWMKLSGGSKANNTLYGGINGERLMPRPSGFYVDAVAGTRYLLQGTTATNVGVWVHWALVRSGTTLTVYRDGVSVATRSDLPADTPTDLSGQIGRLGTAYPAKATIDDVAVYSRALTAAEVAGDYAARTLAPSGGDPTPPPPPTGPFYVDYNSRGGACDDARTAAQAASISTPWCTLARAASAAPDSATILVRAATYPATSIDGAVHASMLTFKPYGSELAVLHGLSISNSSYLHFEHFSITDVTQMTQATRIELVSNDISPNDIQITSGSMLLIQGNTIHDLTMDIDPSTGHCSPPRCGYGIRIITASDVTIRGNTFSHIPADGIQSGQATRYLIENNTFEDILPFVDPTEHSDAIQFYTGSDFVTIRNNAFIRTRGPLIGDPGGSVPERDLDIENNLLTGQRDWALKIYNAPRLKLIANTVWDSHTGVIVGDLPAITEKTTSAIALNNIIDTFSATAGMFTTEDYNLIGTGLRGGAHDLAGPPKFVDAANLDYRLAADSPGIDAGTSAGTPDHDQPGAPRVDTPGVPNTGGGTVTYYDMGALEYSGDGPVTPPGAYSAHILALPGLLSYWRLGDASGTVAQDQEGGRDGTYRNGIALGSPGAISGDADTAVTLDGVDDYVSLPALPSSVDFTIEGWQNLSASSSGNNTLYGGSLTVRVMPRPAGFYAGVYLGGKEYMVQGVTASNTGKWVHWAFVRHGASLDVYRDGIDVGGRSDLPSTSTASLTGAIGRAGGSSYPTKGAIDDVAVYSSALDRTEIAAHAAYGA